MPDRTASYTFSGLDAAAEATASDKPPGEWQMQRCIPLGVAVCNWAAWATGAAYPLAIARITHEITDFGA